MISLSLSLSTSCSPLMFELTSKLEIIPKFMTQDRLLSTFLSRAFFRLFLLHFSHSLAQTN